MDNPIGFGPRMGSALEVNAMDLLQSKTKVSKLKAARNLDRAIVLMNQMIELEDNDSEKGLLFSRIKQTGQERNAYYRDAIKEKRADPNELTHYLKDLISFIKAADIPNDANEYILTYKAAKRYLAGKYVINSNAVKNIFKDGLKKNKIRQYKQNGKTMIAVVLDDSEDVDVEALLEELIVEIKLSGSDNEEGFLSLSEEQCLKALDTDVKVLDKVLKLGIEQDKLHEYTAVGGRLICWNFERKLDLMLLD